MFEQQSACCAHHLNKHYLYNIAKPWTLHQVSEGPFSIVRMEQTKLVNGFPYHGPKARTRWDLHFLTFL